MRVTYYCQDCGSRFDSATEAVECCASECRYCGKPKGVFDYYTNTDICGCDYYGVNTKDVAKVMGIDIKRDLAQACADYYLLAELDQIHGSIEAGQRLEAMASELVPEFELYLDLALGGELRYADGSPRDIGLEPIPQGCTGAEDEREANVGNRGKAWIQWSKYLTRADRADIAYEMFDHGPFWPSSGFGGRAWRDIAYTLRLRTKDNLDPVKWLDRVWNLQHNGGCAFNKVYECGNLQYAVLPAHGNEDTAAGVATLLEYASEAVANLYRDLTTNPYLSECYTVYGASRRASELEKQGNTSGAENLRNTTPWAKSPHEAVSSYINGYSGKHGSKRTGQLRWQSHASSE